MSQVLDTGGIRPPVSRRGARPARYDEALRDRQDVTAVSTLCAGRYCLQLPGHRPAVPDARPLAHLVLRGTHIALSRPRLGRGG
ncbi:hypothetical protein GCM10010304_01970 [Streptomyces roseoviolaceus]